MLHPRTINDLCRFPSWLIDNLELTPGRSLVINGWALADRGDLMNGEIALDGKKPDAFHRIPSFGLVDHFRWHENTEMAGFRAVFNNVNADSDILRFSYRGRWSLESFNKWQDIHFPLRSWLSGDFIEPDAHRMTRTQGTAKFNSYVMYGTTVACLMNETVQSYFGKSLSDFRNICDWGCGCGRVVQGVRKIASDVNLIGIDIDRDNIEWCQINLTFAEFHIIPLFPPTKFTDGQFDLLYGISVFTHLTRPAFEAWRDELHRIVRPGGVVLVTVNLGASLVRSGDETLILRTIESGFDDQRHDYMLGDNIEDKTYYRSTYLTAAEARRIFGVRFRVRDILPQASASSQDLMVCERL